MTNNFVENLRDKIKKDLDAYNLGLENIVRLCVSETAKELLSKGLSWMPYGSTHEYFTKDCQELIKQAEEK